MCISENKQIKVKCIYIYTCTEKRTLILHDVPEPVNNNLHYNDNSFISCFCFLSKDSRLYFRV